MVVAGSIDNDHLWDTVREACRLLGEATGPLIPVLVATTLAVMEILECIMVLSERLFENLQNVRKKRREEGRAEMQTKWERWNTGRREAAMRGEPFDVPPPTLNGQD